VYFTHKIIMKSVLTGLVLLQAIYMVFAQESKLLTWAVVECGIAEYRCGMGIGLALELGAII